MDVIAANGRHWPEQNQVFINNGRGIFTVSYPLAQTRETSYATELADFDGDGDPDVVSISYGTDGIHWWENTDGNGGSWTEHIVIDSWVNGKAIYASDINGDRIVDFIGGAIEDVDDVILWEIIQIGDTK